MARNSASRSRWLRLGVAGLSFGSWMAAASLAQALFGTEIGGVLQRLEERIEQQLEHRGCPAQDAQPERSHEEESIEPWELVSV
jgi:hypothetical protein